MNDKVKKSFYYTAQKYERTLEELEDSSENYFKLVEDIVNVLHEKYWYSYENAIKLFDASEVVGVIASNLSDALKNGAEYYAFIIWAHAENFPCDEATKEWTWREIRKNVKKTRQINKKRKA